MGFMNKPVSSSYLSLSTSIFCSSESASAEPNSVENWEEMECRLEYMQTQVEEAKAALARKHMQQQELVERVEKAEANALEFENKCHKAKEEIIILQNNIKREKQEKQAIRISLRQSEIALRKQKFV